MLSDHFDFAIVGGGAAGLHLALAFLRDQSFRSSKILLLEQSAKDKNDRTWCFWEPGNGYLDDIVHKFWDYGEFISNKGSVELELTPYRYKMIRSLDFYQYCFQEIEKSETIQWLQSSVSSITSNGNQVKIDTDQGSFSVDHVFDSRIDGNFKADQSKYRNLLQHFKGWFIETDIDSFDPEKFVMMDYRPKWNDSTSFMYLLPTSANSALLEFTFFSPELVEEEIYDQKIEEYLKEYLSIESYKIKETEKGIIPMNDYPFHKLHQQNITKIGTAGGWVRPSSGYSFKNAERYSLMILNNIKNNRRYDADVAINRFRKYDTLFLDVLQNHNEMGEKLFASLYEKNSIQQVLKFLDEETSFSEDLHILNSFNPMPFIKALFRNLPFLVFGR